MPFFSLFRTLWLIQIFAFSKKLCYEEELFSPVIWEIDILFAIVDLLTAFFNAQYQEHINLNFLCCHDDFVTTPWQWWTGRGSPSSSLLIFGGPFFRRFFLSNQSTLNQQTHSTLNKRKKGMTLSELTNVTAVCKIATFPPPLTRT